ncbi:MAG TPA: hypothetical protein VE974_20700 [Thermoanaerobaculia bacterium]|nr:hypothetical protein [Thermoanaerobaculia bacterium]
MGKAKETPADAAPGEFGPLTYEQLQGLPEDVKRRRMQRTYEKAMALRGKVHLDINIDELRGRNRR